MTEEFSDILVNYLNKNVKVDWSGQVLKDVGYEIFKKQFNYQRHVYDSFVTKIVANQDIYEKYDDIIRFYYFWCKRPSLYINLKPDFKLIVIFSVVEYLMSSTDYITFSDWLFKELKKGKIKITNASELHEALGCYYSVYGTKKNVRQFIKDNFEERDIEMLMGSLKVFDKTSKKYVRINDVKDFILFVEGIRNLFIHSATNIQIGTLDQYKRKAEGYDYFSSSTATHIGGKSYVIDNSVFHIEGLLESFEKALINYFKKS